MHQYVLPALQDRVSTIRSLCIGISAHQKLDHLANLVTLLGYESLAVFGDCFDEVSNLQTFCNNLRAGQLSAPYKFLYALE